MFYRKISFESQEIIIRNMSVRNIRNKTYYKNINNNIFTFLYSLLYINTTNHYKLLNCFKKLYLQIIMIHHSKYYCTPRQIKIILKIKNRKKSDLAN